MYRQEQCIWMPQLLCTLDIVKKTTCDTERKKRKYNLSCWNQGVPENFLFPFHGVTSKMSYTCTFWGCITDREIRENGWIYWICSGPSQLNTKVPVSLELLWPRSSLNATWSEHLCGPLFPHSISLEKILFINGSIVKAINAALCAYF